MEIPNILIRQIQNGNVILFLGAGATKGAIHPEGKDSPSGKELSNLIAEHFLGSEYKDMPLASVAEYAISESSLFSVQKFIADIFSKYEPAEDSHMLIPTYKWKAIVTTNYDTIIEKAYSYSSKKRQTLVKIVQDGESIDSKIQTPNDLLYMKLHGCINEAYNDKIPFILTVDQYITHKRHRERLFSKLLDLAGNYPILFIGHSLEDPDIRSILLELNKEIENRERSYIVIPEAKEAQKRLWQSKKITIIEATFANFMQKLQEEVKEDMLLDWETKKEDLEKKSHFFRYINISNFHPSENIISYLENDLEFVTPEIETTSISPNLFYKGYSNGWHSIIENWDIKRTSLDDILAELFIDFEEDSMPHLYLIKGHAGTGKTILNKRIAWSAGIDFNKKAFYLCDNSILRYDIIEEVYSLIKERIYIFVDNASKNESDIYNLIITSKRNNIPVTIITTERTNIWNVECVKIKNFVEQSYELKYLDLREINELLDKLNQNDSLGVLKGKSRDVQIQSFTEKTGRELLVALYEATQGKSFQEIVCDEYNNIPDEAAKPLYLAVCLMHSIGSYTRAGLLNRVFNVNFSDFKEKFFEPLENLILDRRDYYVNDYVYESRHRLIAEFVTMGILTNEQEKFDEYIRILNHLDVDYNSDKNAFLYLTNGKTLLRTFRNLDNIRHLYFIASKKSIDDPKLMQQEAIFEMTAPGGNSKRAEELLKKANELTNSSDILILHSLSELKYNLAEKTENILQKRNYLQETEDICKALLAKRVYTAHPYHTIIKSKLAILKIYLDEQELAPIEKISKEIEKYISIATQAFPEETFILEANANFNTLMNNTPKAKELLEEAFHQNNRSPYLASRLSSMYENEGFLDKAIDVLKQTLGAQPADKDLNYKMGVLLSKEENKNLDDILFYLRRSFTKGDNRYHAQFWYARALYLNNQILEALNLFSELKGINIDPKIKYHPRGILEKEFTGTINRLSLNSGMVRRDIYGDDIFFFKRNEKGESLDELKRNDIISYNVGFNYCGPIAVNIKIKQN